MASMVLLLGLFVLSVAGVSGGGTVVELYDYTVGPSRGLNPVWVTPNPLTGSRPGCVNLPKGFVPRSGRFTWNANNAAATPCSFVLFFYKPDCEVPEDGPNVPAIRASTKTTTLNNFAVTSYAKDIPKAVSVGCSFAFDPCVRFPCDDTNAVCISQNHTIEVNPTTSFVANNTRDCSTCKPGTFPVRGRCTDVCASVRCPSGTRCTYDASTQSAVCQCPSGQKFDSTSNQCVSAAQELWMPLITNLRAQNGVSSLLQWNSTLEGLATAHASSVRDAQCKNSPSPTLTMLRNPAYSENNAFTSGTQSERAAFSLWTQPNPRNTAVKFIARIMSTTTKQVGCGKALCGSGAFHTCLFTPRTV